MKTITHFLIWTVLMFFAGIGAIAAFACIGFMMGFHGVHRIVEYDVMGKEL